jgi:hypothetical protein
MQVVGQAALMRKKALSSVKAKDQVTKEETARTMLGFHDRGVTVSTIEITSE